MSALLDQLQAEIGWLKLITRIAGERANVTPQEVDDEMARMRASSADVEYRVAEIYLPIDDPAEQSRVEDLANRLVADTRTGANFAALARTFSQAPSASSGGDLGWVPRDELDGQMEATLSRLEPGQVSEPIRSHGGYFVLYLLGRRSGGEAAAGRTTVTLQQILLPFATTQPSQAEVNSKAEAAQQMLAGAHSCAELEARGKESGALSRTLTSVDMQQLPPDVQRVVQPLQPGQSTQPVRLAQGILALMVCDRQEETATSVQRTAVERRLREQRLSATARRQLRDLRRGALLDVRL